MTGSWMPISSAPKDRSDFFLAAVPLREPGAWSYYECCWAEIGGGWVDANHGNKISPTYWTPIRPPPGESDER